MKNFKLIELTHTVDPTAPTWDGSCGFCHTIRNEYAKEGCRTHEIRMQGGIGTHMDAPVHFIPSGMDIADIPLENLIVSACILDVSKKADEDYQISLDDIFDFEKQFGKITENSLVIAYTGWGRFWKDPIRYRNQKQDGRMHFPSFSENAAKLLVERNVSGIGIDTLSPDVQDASFPVHHLILGAGKYIIENLAHLERMPQAGSFVIALPLKIQEGSECAIRAVGLVCS